jgi:MFS family permease
MRKATDRPATVISKRSGQGVRSQAKLLLHPVFWLYNSFYLIWAAGRAITFTFAAKYMLTVLNFNLKEVAGIQIIQMAVGIAVLYGLGKVSDRTGSRFWLTLVTAFVALSMYLWVGTAWIGVPLLIAYYIINGAAGQTHAMLGINLALEIFPKEGRSVFLALSRFTIGLASVITPIIAGFFMTVYSGFELHLHGAVLNEYHLVFFTGATITLFSALPLVLMGNRRISLSDIKMNSLIKEEPCTEAF